MEAANHDLVDLGLHQCLLRLQTVPRGDATANLAAADKFWHRLCNSQASVPTKVISESDSLSCIPADARKYDVVVLGGTLGIFLATALLIQGKSVAVVERFQLRGREQEWNISRADMKVFLFLAGRKGARCTLKIGLTFSRMDTENTMKHALMHSVHGFSQGQIIKSVKAMSLI